MARSRSRLVARDLVIDLAPIVDEGFQTICFGVDQADGVYVALGRPVDTDAPRRPVEWSQICDTEYRIVRWLDGDVQTLSIASESVAATCIQPTHDGVLLAGHRHHAVEYSRNGVEYSWNGTPTRRFEVGHGFEDVRTAPDGSIWVSFSDYGMSMSDLWAHGLVSYSSDGEVRYVCDIDELKTATGGEPIDDVYAMNVAGIDDVWIYFYSAFSIVHVRDEALRAWTTPVEGARVLVVRDDRAMLVGDYHDYTGVARIITLGADGHGVLVDERTLVDADGNRLSANARMAASGETLTILDGLRVLRVDEW